MKKIILFSTLTNLLIFGNPCWTSAQSVGVSGQGLIPNVSALLDVDASGMTPKGVLIPRITLASNTDVTTIATPANSLLVYNTGTSGLSPAGYYYNQGTTVAANWVPFLTNNVNTFAAWTLTGNSGTTASVAAIGSPVTASSNFVGTTDTRDFVFATDNKERMRISSTGYIGLGTSTPATKLELKDVANTELIRFNNSTNSTTSGFYTGAGSPEGVVTANMASIFADQTNGKIYKKSTGSGNTGWNEMVGTTAHMAKMTRDAVQAITENTYVKIAFDAEEFDIGNIADYTANDRFDIVRSGKYLITAFAALDNLPAGGPYKIFIYKNGVSLISCQRWAGAAVNDDAITCTDVFDLVATDQIEMYLWWNSGGASFRNSIALLNQKPRMSVIELSGVMAGDVVGPASSTDNAIVRFDGTSGKTLQNSGVIIDDANNVTGVVSFEVGGSLKLKTTTITGSTTLTDAHNVILANPTGDITITLPAAASSTDKIYYIKKIDGAGDMVTIDGNGNDSIDGATMIQLYEKYDYVRIVSDGVKWFTVDGFQEINPMVAEGRLSLASGTPVTTSNITAATSVYFTPCKGNRIALYDNVGLKWYIRKFNELPISLTGYAASTLFDVFIYDNSGTVALETVAWTNGTTRATNIVLQDGVYVKSGTTTKRYLGTFRTNATGAQTEDNETKRFVWNMNNRVTRPLFTCPAYNDNNAGTSYSTTSTTFVEANSGTASKVEYILGLIEDAVSYDAVSLFYNTTAAQLCYFGVGEDSQSTAAVSAGGYSTNGDINPAAAGKTFYPSTFGYHYLDLLIRASANTAVWYADLIRAGGSSDPKLTYLKAVIIN